MGYAHLGGGGLGRMRRQGKGNGKGDAVPKVLPLHRGNSSFLALGDAEWKSTSRDVQTFPGGVYLCSQKSNGLLASAAGVRKTGSCCAAWQRSEIPS